MNHGWFEWDAAKDSENQRKHGVSFDLAREAFMDVDRVIAEDVAHSEHEARYFCMGRVGGGVLTVRFTWRNQRIRIIGAGYWRKGRDTYVRENSL